MFTINTFKIQSVISVVQVMYCQLILRNCHRTCTVFKTGNSDSSKSSVEQSNEEALKAPTMGVQVQVENAAEHCQSNPCDTTEEGKKGKS